jgi:chromosome segregation ATPase
MEDVSLTEPDNPRFDELSHALVAQRARVVEFVAAHQQRLRQAEAAFESALARMRQEDRELEERRRDYATEADELSRRRQKLEGRLAEAEQAGEALAAERQETKIQRRRIAEEFKAQREVRLKELRRERDELEQLRGQLERKQAALGEAAELAAQLEGARRECAAAEQLSVERASTIEATEGRLCAAAAEIDSLQRRLNEALEVVTTERAAFEARLSEARQAGRDEATEAASATVDVGAAAEFAAERDRLNRTLRETEERLHEAQQRLAEAPGTQTVRDLDDARRRYEMAMEDLREQKQRTSELERRLAEAAKPSAAPAPAGPIDWETQKRRLLAALEANAGDDENDSERHGERLRIQDVIAQTEAALAGKEKELEELRRHVADKANHDAAQAAAAASDAAISNDEVVRTERERLRQLQLEWEEKLRQAEIDLSVERAKMARERAEVEELQRQFKDVQEQSGDETASGKEKKPQRGRWLARLGLKEEGKE